MATRFVQIHTLTHYPSSLLNRDDAGFAKRMPLGGAIRTRISSQCLKRHWRMYKGENDLRSVGIPESVRSRVSFDRFVADPLMKDGISERTARAAAQAIVDVLFGTAAKKDKAQKKSGKKEAAEAAPEATPEAVATAQVTVVGKPELEYLLGLARNVVAKAGRDAKPEAIEAAVASIMKDKDLKKNLAALKHGAGLGAALFGRMVTGDILSATDAAIHVAHALTVHGQLTESDYFTAIDDLIREEGEQGSGHINASELTSGLFYGYVVVDVNALVSNLGGEGSMAGEVIEKLIHIVATVSPGAKKGSTAPYAYSHLVLVECGKRQPRTFQNAFIEPVGTRGNLVQNAYSALQRHIAEVDGMYGKFEERAHAGLHTGDSAVPFFENRMPLAEVARWARSRIDA